MKNYTFLEILSRRRGRERGAGGAGGEGQERQGERGRRGRERGAGGGRGRGAGWAGGKGQGGQGERSRLQVIRCIPCRCWPLNQDIDSCCIQPAYCLSTTQSNFGGLILHFVVYTSDHYS